MLGTPKWIGLTLATVAVIVAFGALSLWQWQRAHRDDVQALPVAAAEVFGTTGAMDPASYGSRVETSGVYDSAHQVLVRHDDRTFWVVTPLRPTAGLPIPVVRGTVSSPDDPAVAALPAGVVTVVGVAQPYEGDPGGTPAVLPPGQTDRITAAGLDLPYDAAPGWIALETQDPASSPAMAAVTAPVSADTPGSLRLQNTTYAVQWILFAAFVMFFWYRMLRDDVRGATPSPTPSIPVREVY
jgi:cytochrome oxidase assembly protein ShyY1